MPGVQQYYDQLTARDGQRAVRAVRQDVASLVERNEGVLAKWARNAANNPLPAPGDEDAAAAAAKSRSGGSGGRIN